MQSVFVKALAVIESCKTMEQLRTSERYLHLAKYYYNYADCEMLYDRLYDKMYKINKTR